jgi:leucyl/phenylalanyl-tRNA---protein transferase
MPIFWLQPDDFNFPHPSLAEPNGLLAVGDDLSPERLVNAYRNGIFPWFEDDGYFFWYSPDPRFVLFPQELKVHKSMRSIFNQHKFEITLDTAFEAVMRACADTPRAGMEGTWITDDFIRSYSDLYHRGLAHSVEVWQQGELVGGLYGLALGHIFYGESMFARVPNASKAGFIQLVRALHQAHYWLVDCQQETPHLGSLGARAIPRHTFLEYLDRNVYEKTAIGRWHFSAEGLLQVSPLTEK